MHVVTPTIRSFVRLFVCAGTRDTERRDTARSPSRQLLSELGDCSRGEPLVLEAKLGGVDGRENWWRERPPLPPAGMPPRALIAPAFGLVGDTSRRVDDGGAASDGAESGERATHPDAVAARRGRKANNVETGTWERERRVFFCFVERRGGNDKIRAITPKIGRLLRASPQQPTRRREGSRLTLAPSVCSADSYNHGQQSRRLL